jgi:hypothetical protein
MHIFLPNVDFHKFYAVDGIAFNLELCMVIWGEFSVV